MLELSENLLVTEPETIAKSLANVKFKSNVTNSQVRKYYDDFLILQKKANINPESFKKSILPLIKFAKAKLAYGLSRDNTGLTKDFTNELNKKIDRIETKQCFDNFILFYQALIGYLKYEMKEKSNIRK